MTAAYGPWKACVFDFDGTLAELNIDFAAMRASILELMTAYRIPPLDLPNLPVLELIAGAAETLAGHDRPRVPAFLQEARAKIEAIELQAAREGALFPESRLLLAELRRRAIDTAVVTRNCRAALLQVFPDLACCCKAVITRDDVGRVKPHPDHLLAALELIGAAPADTAMVGDHPIDIHLGRKVGAFTIGVLTGHSRREDFLAARADLVLDKAAQILDCLA
ncbi:MAG: HAD family hydrolase [Deltaproteobacteria bacterium]|nr:HAD family hydrolase [Deltaproteobacteria bacterium]